VIGGGIGGMSSAIALEKAGIDVEVYEAVQEMKPVGAAISIWPNGVKCLNALGMKAALRELGGNMAFMAYHDGATGVPLTRFRMAPLVQQVGEYPYPVARAELQAMLIDTFGRERVQFGKRVIHVEQT
ncbi:FAD-dependent monooxygenase, partial [Duffyella gerundensis]|uniref:FAD-dependent monooxygenase n=1 Tax=Duffyella gerundensis TaxID=1619313 RepID=UPI001CA40B10